MGLFSGISSGFSKGFSIGKSFGKSIKNTLKSAAKGDIVGAAQNLGNTFTMGTVDLTGRNQGLINVNTNKYLAKMMGAPTLGAAVVPTSVAKKKGLLSQLRQSKGTFGGGSYSETAKNPLGGSSGVFGK